ncbi:MAG: SEC-C domain-containing protein [Candidatus Microthrix sp.]|nr:SEC-C domain-containing protein [Candidatus Microthrix sp.]
MVEDLPKLTLLPRTYRKVIDDLQDEIEVWADNTPPPMARRNERCPCGSGRKYKVSPRERAARSKIAHFGCITRWFDLRVSRRTTRSIRSLGF